MPVRSVVLLAASLFTGCLAVLMYVQESDLVLLREDLNHPFALGVLACALMALAALRPRRRWLLVLAGLGAGAGLFTGLAATAGFGGDPGGRRADVPGGPGPRLGPAQDHRVSQLLIRRRRGLR